MVGGMYWSLIPAIQPKAIRASACISSIGENNSCTKIGIAPESHAHHNYFQKRRNTKVKDNILNSTATATLFYFLSSFKFSKNLKDSMLAVDFFTAPRMKLSSFTYKSV